MRRTYSILAIAYRHPRLFSALMKLKRIDIARVFADSQNEMNRVF